MTDKNEPRDLQPRVDQTAASQILRRVAEIEAGKGMPLSISDLRAAAIEAGFSASAFDEAVHDVMNQSPSSTPDERPSFLKRIRSRISLLWKPTAIALAAGLAIGFLVARPLSAANFEGDNSAFIGTIAMIGWIQLLLASGALAFRNRKGREIIGFLTQNAALWLGWYAGLMTTAPMLFPNEFPQAFAAIAAASMLVTSPIGCAIIALRLRRSKETGGDGQIAESTHSDARADAASRADAAESPDLRNRNLLTPTPHLYLS